MQLTAWVSEYIYVCNYSPCGGRSWVLWYTSLHIFVVITSSLCVRRHQGATSPDLEYEFVTPSEDFYCPVTKDVLLDPHQTRCCGNILSAEAVTKIQEDGAACPICKKAPFETYSDQNFGRRVREQKVYCPNKIRGCDWVGELSSVGSHKETCQRKDSPKETDTAQPSQAL